MEERPADSLVVAQVAPQRQASLQKRLRRIEIRPGVGQGSQVMKCVSDIPPLPSFLGQYQSLFTERARPIVIALLPRKEGESPERVHAVRPVSNFPEQRKGFLESGARFLRAALSPRHPPEMKEWPV